MRWFFVERPLRHFDSPALPRRSGKILKQDGEGEEDLAAQASEEA